MSTGYGDSSRGQRFSPRDSNRMRSLFYQAGFDVPLVQGCGAYLICRLLPEPHNQQTYDLFIGEVAAVWADDRVYADGRWLFDSVPDELKTLHYVGNGLFYRTGKGLKVG
ncbi:MAG: flavin reductase [Eikenella corrodens]